MNNCIYCEREFEGAEDFCGTYCEQSFWMSPSAAKQLEAIKAQSSEDHEHSEYNCETCSDRFAWFNAY